ncbi:type 3 dihydrofolate reductase [Buchnera aphidicola (Aphis fabae)]|uniref:Dihydrofolate reductase n=1 Tax=Buchnera aphidicola (Aphis fabae) TaxID=571430 RepID=A0A5J6ZBU6_9GAMM|nr:type 3 dihydrofolate reductase [Buchnera aphidicola]QFQ32880.1 type 3 dihydrofolate reductase [Buchnera aphidicola (Aphis fabae)]
MKISLIAALSNNFVIGNKNKIPWHLPEDLKWFKKNTIHKNIIMGRLTYESIINSLPMRTNIVISRKKIVKKNIIWADSINNAIVSTIYSKYKENQEIMVIGGSEIYKQMLFYANKLYLTHVNCNIIGDSYFPKYTLYKNWKKIFERKIFKDSKHSYDFYFEILER